MGVLAAKERSIMWTQTGLRSSTTVLLLLSAIGAYTRGATASPDQAQLAFNTNCRTCHTTKLGDNRLGPSLAHIVGARSGTRPGYGNSSAAMKMAGITWDEQTLDRFIANPESVVPNNNMKPFSGVSDAATRKAIIEHLKAPQDASEHAGH
jgi:cytochrome c